MKKLFCIFTAVALLLAALCAFAEDPIYITEIQKYGNIKLSILGSDLLSRGFDYGDVVTVTLGRKSFDMPIGANYSDVPQGSMICRLEIKPENNEDHTLIAINVGDFATTAGIAEKILTDADPGYIWHYLVDEPVSVSFAMKEKGGYLTQLTMNQLIRSEKRESYPELTDEEFANYRAVTTTGMGTGRLYRSSSPVNPEINRNRYADKAAEAAGVKSFINLVDDESTLKSYPGFSESYYSKQTYLLLDLDMDFFTPEFKDGLIKAIRFIGENEAPYLVHCTEGKDRAGYVCAMLECLMGAELNEVIADYMVTFYNFYGVLPSTEHYDLIASGNIVSTLCKTFGLTSLERTDLSAAAEAYLLAIGSTAEEIDLARKNLGD